MAAIYDMSTGAIVSENPGITKVEKMTVTPEYCTALHTVELTATPGDAGPCDAYMTLIQELLKDLDT